MNLTFWTGAVVGGIVGNGAFALVLLSLKYGWREALPRLKVMWRLSGLLNSVRMIAFNRSRDDYSHSHKFAPSVAAYASQAKRELQFVSITLASGVKFDGLCQVLRKLLEQTPPVSVTISLLNPSNEHLMRSLCASHELDAVTLTQQVQDTLDRLTTFKKTLSQNGQANFQLRVHNTVPVASAILVDPKEADGRIQLETKAYQAPYRESFGFELMNGGSHQMYSTLADSYQKLINDGELR